MDCELALQKCPTEANLTPNAIVSDFEAKVVAKFVVACMKRVSLELSGLTLTRPVPVITVYSRESTSVFAEQATSPGRISDIGRAAEKMPSLRKQYGG